jgi:F-type H+-transporting ATPase subunit epsilon
MSTITLHLLGAGEHETIPGVSSFLASDASGHFGILPRREPLLTILAVGLARYRCGDGPWSFLGLTGGLLHFADDTLRICTSRYLRDTHPEALQTALEAELHREEGLQRELHSSMRQLEEEMLRRLWRIPGGEII